MKFHQDNLNGFQVTERTRLECKFCYFLFQRAITPKICNLKLWFLCSARRLMLVTDHVKFHQVTLNGLQVTERKRFVTDRQTYGRTDGQTTRTKTVCLRPIQGGDIMSHLIRKQQCGFRTGPTQTELNKHKRWLEAGNFGFRK